MSTADPQYDPQALVRKKRARLKRFATRVLLVFAPAHAYVGWRLLTDLPVGTVGQGLGLALLALSTVLIPYGTLARLFLERQALVDRLVWAGSLAMGLFSFLFVFTLIRDLALLLPGSAAWRAESAFTVVAAALAATVVGFYHARRLARVIRVDVPLAGLPEALQGFQIAQITDLHVGSTIKGDYVRGIVERVNGLDADLIALTGDLVDGTVADLKADTEPLGRLRSRHGAFVVTGNHEYYSGAEAWMAEFGRLGLNPLRNAHRVVEHDGARLVIAGINDYSAARLDPENGSNPRAALDGSPDGAPRVLLAHQPRSATAAGEAGFDLQLSGHTHGGQFWPWNHFVRFQQPYIAGLHKLDRLWVYTSRGTGYWGPPNRFGAPSEITLLRLVAAPSSE